MQLGFCNVGDYKYPKARKADAILIKQTKQLKLEVAQFQVCSV